MYVEESAITTAILDEDEHTTIASAVVWWPVNSLVTLTDDARRQDADAAAHIALVHTITFAHKQLTRLVRLENHPLQHMATLTILRSQLAF